jgi:glycosyltransferase involved in cell wall biosynthesis
MNSSLKVCIEARLENAASGGIQQVLIGLASGLSDLTDGDEEYLFLTRDSGGEWLHPYLSGACRAVPIPSTTPPSLYGLIGRLKRIAPLRRAVRALREARPVKIPAQSDLPVRLGAEVMHFPFQVAYPVAIPSIYHPHDLQHLHLPQFFSPAQIRDREITYRYFCNRADLVAVTSTWIKRDLVAQYQLPEDRIAVIPLAPVLDSYSTPAAAEIAATAAKLGLPKAFGFYPAQTWPHKNHIGLLRAIKDVRDRTGQSIPFVFSGFQNSHFSTIEKVISELNLGGTVHFVGFVTPSELKCLYQLARCVVIPTKFEAASLPLWEAFIAGVPAACSNVTSLPEQAGGAALIFDPDSTSKMSECIQRLWTDEDVRRALVQRGREKVASFTWSRTVRTFRSHYRRLAGRALSSEDSKLLAAAPRL